MLTRKPNWVDLLDAFMKDRAKTPFAWGSNDCALFAADAVLAVTGTDIADDFRGKYSDEAGAFALIQSVTGLGAYPATAVGDAAAYCATRHDLVEYEHPLFAQRGDLVAIENGRTLIAGVVHLNGRHVIGMAADGPVRLPITAINRSWKV